MCKDLHVCKEHDACPHREIKTRQKLDCKLVYCHNSKFFLGPFTRLADFPPLEKVFVITECASGSCQMCKGNATPADVPWPPADSYYYSAAATRAMSGAPDQECDSNSSEQSDSEGSSSGYTDPEGGQSQDWDGAAMFRKYMSFGRRSNTNVCSDYQSELIELEEEPQIAAETHGQGEEQNDGNHATTAPCT